MPMPGFVSPVTTGGATIDEPVDYLDVTGDGMEPQHDVAARLDDMSSTRTVVWTMCLSLRRKRC